MATVRSDARPDEIEVVVANTRPPKASTGTVAGSSLSGPSSAPFIDASDVAERLATADTGVTPTYGQYLRKRTITATTDDGEAEETRDDRKDRYADFTTIDWVRDGARERMRRRNLEREWSQSKYGWVRKAWDAAEGWVIVFVVGVGGAFLAAFITISTLWLSDIKLGACTGAFWLNRDFCCWTADTGAQQCHYFKTWAEMLSAPGSASTYVTNYFFYILFSVTFAFLSATLVRAFAPYAAGSGIPEIKTILGGFVIRRYLGLWTMIVKGMGVVGGGVCEARLCPDVAVVAALSVRTIVFFVFCCVAGILFVLSTASGLSIGKEGPLVHVVACWGNVVSRIFRKYRFNEAKRREILSAAAAAGITVAFGAPVGGVLFSLEEVSYYFPFKTMWRSFFCALTAAATLQYLNPLRTGRLVLYHVDYDRPWHYFELLPFIALGVFGGLVGSAIIHWNIRWSMFRRSNAHLRKYPIVEVAAVALLTALINYLNPYQRGSTSELIKDLFSECQHGDTSDLCTQGPKVVWLLLLVALFKIAITVFTFGMSVPAGIFVPSMAIGACVGRVVGIGVQQIVLDNASSDVVRHACNTMEGCITPGLYAMIGAAAMMGGVTRMTVSLVVIIFELTGGLTYVLPVMLTVLASKWVGDAFGREGINDRIIRMNGYPFLSNKESFGANTLVADVLKEVGTVRNLCLLYESGNTLEGLEATLEQVDFNGFPVVTSPEEIVVVGFVGRRELRLALERARANLDVSGSTECTFAEARESEGGPPVVHLGHCLDPSPIQITEDSPMSFVVDLFRRLGLRYALVTGEGKLTGLLTKKDVLKFLAAANNRDPQAINFM